MQTIRKFLRPSKARSAQATKSVIEAGKLTCHACHGSTRCQLPIGHHGEHIGPKHLYLEDMPRVRWDPEHAKIAFRDLNSKPLTRQDVEDGEME